MNARQILIVIGIAIAGFAAALLISSTSGGTEPVAAGKKPAAADTLEVAGATVNATAPSSGALPKLKVPKPKPEKTPEPSSSSTSTTTAPSSGTTTAPSSGTTTAPSSGTTTAPSSGTTTPPASNNGNGGFVETGGED
jgi:hypothetical protein